MAENTSRRKSQTIPSAVTDGRTAAARASDNLPPRFYDPARSHAEPPAVTAARQRHQAINAEIERRRALAETVLPGPDELGYEWRREELLEFGGAP